MDVWPVRGRYATLQAEHKLPVMVKGFIIFIFFFFSLSCLRSWFFHFLTHVLSEQPVVGFVCTSGLFFPLFLSDVGVLILWVVSLWWRRSCVALCCFCCHGNESDGRSYEPVGMKMRDVSVNLWFHFVGLGVYIRSAATVYSLLSLNLNCP